MANLTISKHIDAPIADVFQMCTDVPNWADRIEDIKKIEMLTDGPIGVGTRFKETRIMFKRAATEEMEVTEFEPNRKFTLVAQSCGCRFESVHRFSEQDSGTLIEFEMKSTAQTFFAKMMSWMSFLMMGTMKKCIEKDLDSLKDAAEKTARAGSRAAAT